MSILLRTLGGLSLDTQSGASPGRSTQRKRLALLALLAATRNGGMSRDKIIAYLWPEGEEEQSRHALSQTLYALRRELGDQCITAGIDDLRLNHEIVPSDVAHLNTAIHSRDLARIVGVYTGPFLDGFFLPGAPGFEEWVAERRAEYERAYAGALDELAARAISDGEYKDAVSLLQARAGVDRLKSDVALRLMRAHAHAGDRAGALRHFRAHAALLKAELDMDPAPELAEFAEQCARNDDRPAPPQSAPAPASRDAAPEFVLAPATAPAPARAIQKRLPLALAALLVVAAGIAIATRSQTTHESHVLLASVSGPDSSLSLAVREALRAELEQSEGVRVLNDVVTARTLELMRLPPSTIVDEPRALEVAQRRGVPFVITASVQPVGTGVQIVARMIDATSERVIASVSERPNREEDVLSAVADIAAQMREKVGRIPPRNVSPLPAVTTTSLPALRNYALARRALARWDRHRALELLEGALVHDSSFALAHYLAGDLLWYIDKQRHSDEHMLRAYALVDRLPPREQLIVKARYQQLVRDEPDSALVYWKLLVSSYPDEPLAYEGMRWAYRALGNIAEMAEASQRGAEYDGAQRLNHLWDRSTERIEAGDSAGAVRFADYEYEVGKGTPVARTQFLWQLRRGLTPGEGLQDLGAADAQYVHLLHHRFGNGRAALDSLRSASLQFYPRAILAQARMEWEFLRSDSSRQLLAEVVGWIENADLSPPAYARLSERAAELAAQMGDQQAIARLRAVIDRQDGGRGLRSYRIARHTINTAAAFAQGDFQRAAQLSARDDLEMYYARSIVTALFLRAEALDRAGRRTEANQLFLRIARQEDLTDLDIETRALFAHIARRKLANLAAR